MPAKTAAGHGHLPQPVLVEVEPRPPSLTLRRVLGLARRWRRLGLPQRIKSWSLTSLQQRLMKTGGRLVTHARYDWLPLAEGHLNRRLFGDMLRRILALPVPGG